MKLNFVISVFIIAIVSCKQDADSSDTPEKLNAISNTVMSNDEYKSWFASEDNFQRREQKVTDKTYRLVHLPASMLAMREVGEDANDSVRKEAENHYSDLEYFQLEIVGEKNNGELLKDGIANATEYERRVSYCSFNMQKDISLLADGTENIPCALFHFERSFDVAPVASFMIAFDKKKVDAAKQLTMIFNDNLFQNGMIKFSYSAAELLSSPKLK